MARAEQLATAALLAAPPATLRLAIIHHLVHDPAGHPGPLSRPGLVAAALGKSSSAAGCHVFMLSGHTHVLYPDFEDLPASLPLPPAQRGPLLGNQLQLTAGTACQHQRSTVDQSFQVLRFFVVQDTAGNRLVMERLVYTRAAGEFVEMRDEDGNAAEVVELPI